jgi:hypothetical protein
MRRVLRKIAQGEHKSLGDLSTLADPVSARTFLSLIYIVGCVGRNPRSRHPCRYRHQAADPPATTSEEALTWAVCRLFLAHFNLFLSCFNPSKYTSSFGNLCTAPLMPIYTAKSQQNEKNYRTAIRTHMQAEQNESQERNKEKRCNVGAEATFVPRLQIWFWGSRDLGGQRQRIGNAVGVESIPLA